MFKMFFNIYKNILFNLNKQIFNPKIFCNRICKYSIASSVDKKLLNDYIQNLQKEFEIINTNISTTNQERLQELTPVMQVLKERVRITELLTSLNELSKDDNDEMKKLAEEEAVLYKNKILEIEEQIIQSIVPSDNIDTCDSIVLEISAGVGGQEAMLFAKEIFDMYWNFAEYKGWSCELAEFDTTEIGGLRHASIFINGDEVYKIFKYEAGVHRVQRIPSTEKSSRIHTSTVSVTALPQPRDVDITIHEKDLRIDTKRASGAGGQHVNTTDSAVRIVHLPTNTMVECQVDRSQIKNRAVAMQKLKALLYDKQLNEQILKSEATKKSQVRSNNRNEKIRTYNYSQDRITDHRLQGSNIHNLKVFLEGGEPLDNLITKLHSTAKQELLMDILLSSNVSK